MDYVHPRLIDTSPVLADLLPEALARENHVIAQGEGGRVLTILISDPDDMDLMEKLRFILGRCSSEVRFSYSSGQAIREAIDRIYGTSGRSSGPE